MPAEALDQEAAAHRRRDGDHAEPGQAARHHARAFARRVEVADDRAAARHRRRHRDALQRAPGDQRADARRQRAADAGDDIEREAREEHRPAAEAIGERPAQELREAEADDERRQRQLGGADARAEVALQRRQRGR
jgi:hypothetical protein